MDDSYPVIDYGVFSGMSEHEVRAEIAEHARETERFRKEYAHFNTEYLLDKFNQICYAGSKGALIIASRPFANINNLHAAHANVPVTTIVDGNWYNRRVRFEKDAVKQKEVVNTFNGPALIPNLLPPTDHLVGKFGHPSLVSGKPSAWKDVVGKIEDICSDDVFPDAFFCKEDGYGKKAEKREKERAREVENFIETYANSTLSSFGGHKGYPGGLQDLSQRCFSIYYVKIVRPADGGVIRGFEVEWISDYTLKGGKEWMKKSEKVTVALPKYLVYIHDDGVSFADWDKKALRAQVKEYEDPDLDNEDREQ